MKEFKRLEKLHLFSSEEKGESLENCPLHFDHGDFLVHMHHMNFVFVATPETDHKRDTYGNSHLWIIDFVQWEWEGAKTSGHLRWKLAFSSI